MLGENVVRSGRGEKLWKNLRFTSSLFLFFKVKEWSNVRRLFRTNPNHVSVSYSDSLRCYGGKGGGKFQECHQDDGYKTCFTKYENGKY